MSKGMYAVIGVWSMEASRWDEQQRVLHEQLVPMVSQSPGFVAGYWMGDQAVSKTYTTIVLEDEAAALRFKAFVSGDEARANQEQSGVRNESLTVVEVLAEARH
jgi:hypothetical protein